MIMKLLYFIADQPVAPSVAAFVAKVAMQTNSSVHILAVTSNSRHLKDVQQGVLGLENIFSGLKVTRAHAAGDVLGLLLSELERESYDMVLMGVHRRRKLWPSNFRLLSNKIIRQCPIPIMLVRKVSSEFKRMLVCTGGFKSAKPVVKLSAKLAGTANMKATLLHVAGAVPSMYTGLDEMEETIEELLVTDTPLAQHLRQCAAFLTEHDIEAEIEIRHGNVVEAILQEATEDKYDLIVLGETRARQLSGMLMGNVTQQIINRSASAVLVYKEKKK
jgi:nucleotide-binding universal stress UspA family protein